jgi:hypothetical protein
VRILTVVAIALVAVGLAGCNLSDLMGRSDGPLPAGTTAEDLGPAVTGPQWYELFGPQGCDISYFTEFADFDGDGATDGLIALVGVVDRFGDPIKVLGRFRIETFQYVSRAAEKRGPQTGNWVVNVLTEQDVRRYYDNITRGFRFPLQFVAPPETDRLIVQVTYYLPDGSGEKLFARRLIKPDH